MKERKYVRREIAPGASAIVAEDASQETLNALAEMERRARDSEGAFPVATGSKGAQLASEDDPYHDRKLYHRAKMLNTRSGKASALCYKKPHAIPPHERWTIRDEAVTCPLCRKLISENAPSNNSAQTAE